MKLKRTKAPCLLTITVFVFGVAPPSIRGDYFGTLDGYDSEEGRKAICWQVTPNSTFDIPSSDAAAGVRLALLESNANVELMDRCYQGLELNVTLEEVSKQSLKVDSTQQSLSYVLSFARIQPMKIELFIREVRLCFGST
jgi:hypothetical protein